MRKFLWCVLALLLILAYCTHENKSESGSVTFASFSDSTRYARLYMDVELPDAADDVTENVREALLNVLFDQVVSVGYGDNSADVMPFRGERDDAQEIVDHYGSALMAFMDEQARGDAADRASFGFEGDYPGWECDLHIHKILETQDYWVYNSQNYVYLGGAHGGVTGAGYLAFSKNDGLLIENIMDRSRERELQPLLYAGVKRYFEMDGGTFDKDYLFVEDGIIPLPQNDPCPMGDSILFVYQQYEIAPYAMGMPAFKLPMSQVRDFMTPEARTALGLD